MALFNRLPDNDRLRLDVGKSFRVFDQNAIQTTGRESAGMRASKDPHVKWRDSMSRVHQPYRLDDMAALNTCVDRGSWIRWRLRADL